MTASAPATRARGEPSPAEQFERWLEAPAPEVPRTRCYWRGDLAAESGSYRHDRLGRPVRAAPSVPEAAAVADAAMAAQRAGRVTLTRRRIGRPDDPLAPVFEYLATRLDRRHREDPTR